MSKIDFSVILLYEFKVKQIVSETTRKINTAFVQGPITECTITSLI